MYVSAIRTKKRGKKGGKERMEEREEKERERGGTRHGDKRCVVCRWRSGTFGYVRGWSAVDRANTAAPQPPFAEVSARRCAGLAAGGDQNHSITEYVS